MDNETILDTEPEIEEPDEDLLTPIDDYARKLGVSRRTVDRYVRLGQIETRKCLGRTYVLDRPVKTSPIEKDNVRNGRTSEVTALVRSEWIQFGYLQARAKNKTAWQVSAIVLAFLIVLNLGISGWLYLERQLAMEQVKTAQDRLADKTDQLIATEKRLELFGDEIKGLKAELISMQDKLVTDQAENAITIGRLQVQIASLSRPVEHDPNLSTPQ